MTDTPLHTPAPQPVDADQPWWRTLIAFRRNVIATWPPAAYDARVRVGGFLGRRWLLLNDPDGIRRVLIDNPDNYRRTRATVRILRPIIGRGLFLSDGEDWRRQRRTLAPAFAPRVVPVLARHVATVAADAVARLAGRAGAPVDLYAEMQRVALEIAARSMFSLEMDRDGALLRDRLTRYAQHLGRPYLLDLLLPTAIPTWHDVARWVFKLRWMRLIDRVMARRAAAPAPEGAEPRDLFDLLVAARDPDGGAAFTRAQLRDQLATLLVAGHETTAVALFWSLYLLARAPAEQQRLADEAAGCALTPERAFDALARLPYARAVVSEALRLYPPAFTIVREAIADDRAGDVVIPARTVVMIAPWVLHRHRALWREPERFDPTRFLPDAPPPERFAYLPFGAGPRVCIGAQFALTEATLTLAALVKAFRITLAPGPPVTPVAIVTTRPDHAPSFRLEKR
ncbi:MAG TPA: cytochrome P450 [Candidatus Sulfotelmatobacter sp.]|nr:cytochrome P450 [Candidatus Sulfotelmatobacter sp.]